MDKLILKSPAKLNLYLDVLRKRPDGYHDIETVFEKIALFDIITIRKLDKKAIRITADEPSLPTNSRNLAYKAARLLFDKARFKGGVWVDIQKNIPIAAGLGGGSSNAATALLGINRFFDLGFNKAELVRMGRALGADVPFFLYDCSFAIGTKRGDEISPLILNKDINIWHIIISFGFEAPTKGIYGALNLRLTPYSAGAKMLSRFILRNDIETLGTSLYNRLEEVSLAKFRIVGAAKRLLLREGAYGALLSGSGPTVFGITKTREEAMAVKKRVEKGVERGGKVLVVSTFKNSGTMMKGVQ